MTTRPILLFDVMETLVTEPFRAEMPQFFGMTPAALHEAVHPTAWVEFELGEIEETEFLRRFFADGSTVDGEGLRRCVQSAYRWIAGMETLLGELDHLEYEIYAFSNYPSWYRLIEDSLSLSRFGEWRFVSCHTGIRKPDPEAYMSAAQSLGVLPGDCLFVDDRSVNVDAARKVGMDVILFQDARRLRSEMIRRGLLSRIMHG